MSKLIPMAAKPDGQNFCSSVISIVELSRWISTALQRKDAEQLAEQELATVQAAAFPSQLRCDRGLGIFW